jgi:inositol phosphorylceramide mannosyltransferase catalytic subunit
MSDFRKLMVNILNNDPKWIKIIRNFDDYWVSRNGTEKIPKILHQVWLGGEFPEQYRKLTQTFIDNNPDWEYKLWTDSDVESFNMVNKNVFDKVKNLGAKSDIFRYEILYRYGGLYMDTDFFTLKSFNDFLHLDVFTGSGHVDSPEAFNGLIGITKENSIMKTLIDKIKELTELDGSYDNILNLTGPRFFSSTLFDELDNQKIVMFPTKFFYSFPAVDRFRIRHKLDESIFLAYKTDESYCVHLWYTSWQK